MDDITMQVQRVSVEHHSLHVYHLLSKSNGRAIFNRVNKEFAFYIFFVQFRAKKKKKPTMVDTLEYSDILCENKGHMVSIGLQQQNKIDCIFFFFFYEWKVPSLNVMYNLLICTLVRVFFSLSFFLIYFYCYRPRVDSK